MLKETATVAGGALILSPVGMPFLFHGVAGMLVGYAGLYVANAVMQQVAGSLNKDSQPKPEPVQPVKEDSP
jgi:hypothetical protein